MRSSQLGHALVLAACAMLASGCGVDAGAVGVVGADSAGQDEHAEADVAQTRGEDSSARDGAVDAPDACEWVVAVTVRPATATVAPGAQQQFRAYFPMGGCGDPGPLVDVTERVRWSSSDVSVATVAAGGVATGVGPGSAFVVASFDGVTSNAVALTVSVP